jgi:hypothetical protein
VSPLVDRSAIDVLAVPARVEPLAVGFCGADNLEKRVKERSLTRNQRISRDFCVEEFDCFWPNSTWMNPRVRLNLCPLDFRKRNEDAALAVISIVYRPIHSDCLSA